MIKYSKVSVKWSDTQLKKFKKAVKDKTGTTLRIGLKMFNGNDLPQKLLLTTRQKTKLRNAFNNNMSTDLKLSKAQISKIIQSGGFLGSLLSTLAGPLTKVTIPLAKNVLALLGLQMLLQQLMQEFRKNIWFWNNNFNNFKWRNEWYSENCSSTWRFKYFTKGNH